MPELDELVGLRSAKRIVRQLAETDNGVQAVLIYGQEGAGKNSLAEILVESWIRREVEEDRAVAAYRRGNCPDVLHIHPSPPSNIIRLQAVHQEKPDKDAPPSIREFVRTMTLMAKRKVVVIHDCHRMNKDAANALLKTLEEPLPHVKMLLLTSEIGSVLQTIRSRCLCVACELPTEKEYSDLAEDATDAERRLAAGAPGRLSYLRANRETVAAIAQFGQDLMRAHAGAALVFADRFRSICETFADRQDMPARLSQATCLELLGQFLVRESNINPTWIQQISEAHRRIVGNGSAALVLDAMLTKMLTAR